jgi:hypothetical protein
LWSLFQNFVQKLLSEIFILPRLEMKAHTPGQNKGAVVVVTDAQGSQAYMTGRGLHRS